MLADAYREARKLSVSNFQSPIFGWTKFLDFEICQCNFAHQAKYLKSYWVTMGHKK